MTRTVEYRVTMLDNRALVERLRRELSNATHQTKLALATAMLLMTSIVVAVAMLPNPRTSATQSEPVQESVQIVSLESPRSISESEDPKPKKSGDGGDSGGGGGHGDPLPAQKGKPPQPSIIPAPIPKLAPTIPQSLPVAGINVDPDLWTNLPMPNYGDPKSNSSLVSGGPGNGGGIGTGDGQGIGPGIGPGVGPGRDGGSDENSADDLDRAYPLNHATERVRVLAKPEPQYTEEARQNQVTGTVVLRVVFSRAGQVTNIRAIQSLPFGLTERAIAAARRIRFQPATKEGRPVSVYMQLEYNFNLY